MVEEEAAAERGANKVTTTRREGRKPNGDQACVAGQWCGLKKALSARGYTVNNSHVNLMVQQLVKGLLVNLVIITQLPFRERHKEVTSS